MSDGLWIYFLKRYFLWNIVSLLPFLVLSHICTLFSSNILLIVYIWYNISVLSPDHDFCVSYFSMNDIKNTIYIRLINIFYFTYTGKELRKNLQYVYACVSNYSNMNEFEFYTRISDICFKNCRHEVNCHKTCICSVNIFTKMCYNLHYIILDLIEILKLLNYRNILKNNIFGSETAYHNYLWYITNIFAFLQGRFRNLRNRLIYQTYKKLSFLNSYIQSSCNTHILDTSYKQTNVTYVTYIILCHILNWFVVVTVLPVLYNFDCKIECIFHVFLFCHKTFINIIITTWISI